MIRIPIAVSLACSITIALFFIMQALIRTGVAAPASDARAPDILFGVDLEERPVEPNVPVRYDELRTPVEPLPKRPANPGDSSTIIELPRQDVPRPAPPDGIVAATSGPLVVIVRVQPVYPPRAEALGLEGYVDVEFDVSAQGTVVNARVISSSHRVFEDAALKAAGRFRFKARVVDGIPQPSHGLRNRFTFQLEHG